MRLIGHAPVALVVSASALPCIAFEWGLGNSARADSDSDPQSSLSKCNESSLSSPHLRRHSSVGPTGDFYQLCTGWVCKRDRRPRTISDVHEQLHQLLHNR